MTDLQVERDTIAMDTTTAILATQTGDTADTDRLTEIETEIVIIGRFTSLSISCTSLITCCNIYFCRYLYVSDEEESDNIATTTMSI